MVHTHRRTTRGAAAAVVVLTLATTLGACGATPTPSVQATLPALSAYTRSTALESDTAQAPPTSVDLTFAEQMIVHHRAAVEMSRTLLERTDLDATIADLAGFIVRDQQREIDATQSWLDAWYDEEPDLADHPDADEILSVIDESTMSSHLSATHDGVLAVTAQADFLTLMIAHHEGAIAMSRALVADGGNEFTRTLAKHILVEQANEIAAMRMLLDKLCDGRPGELCGEPDHHH